jgi:hypothetical protein
MAAKPAETLGCREDRQDSVPERQPAPDVDPLAEPVRIINEGEPKPRPPRGADVFTPASIGQSGRVARPEPGRHYCSSGASAFGGPAVAELLNCVPAGLIWRLAGERVEALCAVHVRLGGPGLDQQSPLTRS